ncbi:redox-sensitive bicupin YhaK (pirin superfamily) [Actimicrobium sp. GrIS 1.19]|uniref:pirin family protein n=1 Tax=Actimicrobium sp. GrIS 1.19 TaxID=3071708 RepID=UPI002E06BE2B|nr:redox-sensitive bicupin YhaK (pirin superfamily) [Actimicrobium sp. GrIS 1.19]
MTSNVEAVTAIEAVQRGPGLRIAQLHEATLGASLDPFLMCDCFWMAQPFFPPHPHAGISAVTYMLPESEGGFVNRDSLGNRNLIQPGALHWTEAAAGMMHEETPIASGVTCQGLQIFVNLPSGLKLAEPRTYHLEPDAVPARDFAGAQVRVLAGKFDDSHAGVMPRTDCALWDVTLQANSTVTLPLPDHWHAFGILTKGSLAGFSATGLAAVRFAADARQLVLATSTEHARLVIFSGKPLNEPLAFGGPFVMNTTEQLQAAKRRFVAGEMGHLEASF